MKILLLCPEIKDGDQVKQKAIEKEFEFKHAEKILRKGRWIVSEKASHVWKDGTLIPKAKKEPKKTQTKAE